MTEGSLAPLFWRMADALDHRGTLGKLRILDALTGPRAGDAADKQRERDRDRLRKAFSLVDIDGLNCSKERPLRKSLLSFALIAGLFPPTGVIHAQDTATVTATCDERGYTAVLFARRRVYPIPKCPRATPGATHAWRACANARSVAALLREENAGGGEALGESHIIVSKVSSL
jgi:hypothetical protein